MRIFVLIFLRLLIPPIIVSSIVFFLLRAVPGNPAEIQRGLRGADTSELGDTGEQRASSTLMGDYVRWLGNSARFNFGHSEHTGLPAAAFVMPYMLRTTLLAIASLIGSLCFSCLLVICALRYNWRIVSGTIIGGARLIVAIPEFWLALLLILLFAIKVPLFPLFGSSSVVHYALPLIVLAINRGAVLVELLHGSLVETSATLYTTAARIRGVGFWRILYHYLIKNSLFVIIPLVTIQFGYLFGGAVIIEQVFSLPGFGNILLQSLRQRDYAVAQFSVLLIAVIFSAISLVGDLLHSALNPQIQKRHLFA